MLIHEKEAYFPSKTQGKVSKEVDCCYLILFIYLLALTGHFKAFLTCH